MSRGKNLQEMEVGTKQSRTAVNANARPGDPMPHLSGVQTPGQTGGWEDLGGPDPSNYRSDDDSAKLKDPSATLKQVSDVVNKNARSAMPMQGEEEEEESGTRRSRRKIKEEHSKKKGREEEEEEEEEPSEEEDERDEEEEESEEEDESGKKPRRAKMKEDFYPEEEVEDEYEEVEFDIEEDVNALFEGEELSEEFQDKARTIFEAALRSKAVEIKESLEEQYAVALVEEVEEIKSELQERLDSYLEYVCDEWIKENALVIEHGLKTEMTESFLAGMKELFEAHYVTIPDDKYDVLENMVEKLDDMEEKLNEQIEKNVSLNRRLAEAVADGIFDSISEGLALTQKDKLASLAESVEFESEQEYREKLEILRESYFPSKVISPFAKTETLTESTEIEHQQVSDSMSSYLKALSAFSKNN